MRNRIAIISIVLFTLCRAGAPAQEGDADRDPFHPPDRTVTAPAASPEDVDWGRDPFSSPLTRTAPVQGSEQRAKGSNLTGIIYGKQARLAIIGGEVLREGSMVGDRRLVDIRRQSIVLMDAAGGYEEIFLEDFSIRK